VVAWSGTRRHSEVERRIQRVEARNETGEQRELAGAPAGVPDSFEEHVKLMFDIQALAFAADITRVFSFKMGRDGSSRVYPDSGSDKPFHPASHHGGGEKGVKEFQLINKYHVSMLPYFLDKLKSITEGDSNLLDKTLVMYGSPMGDPNVHNHRRCPLILLGHANKQLPGGLHLKAPDGTPMSNVMLRDPRLMNAHAALRRQHDAFSFEHMPNTRCFPGRGVVLSAAAIPATRPMHGRRRGMQGTALVRTLARAPTSTPRRATA
jgi:hypothetical protein